MIRRYTAVIPVTAMLLVAAPVAAQSIPFADTEDATLSEIDIADRQADWHPVLSFDLRNGDYARGALDDDDASLGRLPVHVAFGGVVIVHRGADGSGRLFVIGQSSNGFHAPSVEERTRPRVWYESNNLLGVAWRPADGLTTAVTYTIKTSPNGIAPTTHEASLTGIYTAETPLGRLKPRMAVTRRTQGEGGIYTIAGIAPSFDLTQRENGMTLSLPITVGIGWNGFYAAGSGDRLFGNGGITLSQPLRIAGAMATVQAELLALIRDERLRRLDGPDGTTAPVVPYATLSLALAW